MAEADPSGSSRIFISYRREDSAGHVLALLPALRSHFGADRIFKDTDNIPPGVDFVKFIKRELESCSVMLAIIGRDWLTVQDPRLKRRRLDNPDDFLRLEVTTALKNERIRVIPVLVDRGVMPTSEDLPPDLAELPLRNALELSDTRWESDVQRLIQAIKRASAATPAQPAEGPSRRPELLDLQRRRAREIAAHLQAAQDAFEAGDYEATLWACEKALVLDPQGPEALELMDRARKAVDDRKIDEWLAEAQQLLNRGDLAGASELIDQVLATSNTSEPALTLRQELLRLRRERERDRERARVVDAALKRARASLDEEDFEAAVRHADDALALDSHSTEAQEIRSQAVSAHDERRRKREHKRRAQQAVTEARAKFATGQREEALRLLREFSPAYELVSQALVELQKEADGLDQRQQRIAALIRDAATAIGKGRFQDGIAHLREVALIEPGRPDVAALLGEAEAGHSAATAAERARREADASLAAASRKFQEQDYAAAQQLIETARSQDPQHPEVGPWLRRIEDARAEQEAALRRSEAIQTALTEARESFDKGELELAIRHADTALTIEPTLDDALALRERAQGALAERRKRDEHERRARQTVAEAQQIFNTKDHKAAIDLLERFSPSHALVSQALGELREQIQEIDRRRRQQEEEEAKRREKAERAAAERSRAETIRVTLARGRENLKREDFQAALRDAEETVALDPHSTEAQALRSAASRGLEQRIQQDERDRLAQQAAAKARAEAAQAAEQRRQAEALARKREEHERQQQALAIVIARIEGHLAAGQLVEAEHLLEDRQNALPASPAVEALRHRAKELRRHKETQAREERIQQSLAEGQSAFAAKAFRDAKAKASEVLELAPNNEMARSLLASATRELRASAPPFWSTARLTGLGAAAAVLVGVTIWIFYGDGTSGPAQPAGAPTSTSATSNSTPDTSGNAQPPTGGNAQPPTRGSAEPTPVAATPAASTASSGEPSAGNLPATNDPRLQQLVPLREAARRQFQSGQRDQALNTAVQGLQIDPKDTALQSVLDSLLRDAQSAAQRAKEEARTSGADSLPQTAFAEAVKLEEEAIRFRTANRKDPAIRALWNAADRFVLAARQATTHTAEQKLMSDDLARKKQLADEQARQQLGDDLARKKQLADEQARQEELKLAAERARPAPPPEKPRAAVPQRPPAINLADEERLVRAALQQYENAYTRLSAADVQKVYPSVKVDQVVRAFADIRSYELKIQIQKIEFSQNATSATVFANASHDVRARAGAPTRQSRPQTFTLEKQGNTWVIVQVR